MSYTIWTILGHTRTDNFGILSIVITIVASMWLFGFTDTVFSTFQTEFDELENNLSYEYSKEIKESQTTDDEIQENTVPVSPQPVLNKPILSDVKEKIISSEPVTSTPKDPIIEEERTKQTTEESLKDKIKRLEEQSFTLSGNGSGYEGSAHLSEYAKLDMKLNPVLGTELSEFSIRRGTLEVGGYTFVIEGGQVILEQNTISVNIKHDDHRDPYLNMKGTINGSILDHKTLFVTFEDQLLGLTEADPTPIHLSLELKMEIQN